MLKRLCLVLGLAALVVSLSGCCGGASAFVESVGGCCPVQAPPKRILCHQARQMRLQQEFLDTYFLNYDVHDPYRGDCYLGY